LPYLRRYAVLSAVERRSGGQGCVQFVHDASERRDYAVKFFFKADAFHREATLYANPVLRAMMAATRAVCHNADGALRAPNGFVFPPHIVIERGEPMDEWVKRMVRRADGGEVPIISIFQALTNIAQRLQLLHSAGYVHNDIKPSNVLWLADMHGWTLIDFGSTCKSGARALCHTYFYVLNLLYRIQCCRVEPTRIQRMHAWQSRSLRTANDTLQNCLVVQVRPRSSSSLFRTPRRR
jgi:serine/threonine protein kinase